MSSLIQSQTIQETIQCWVANQGHMFEALSYVCNQRYFLYKSVEIVEKLKLIHSLCWKGKWDNHHENNMDILKEFKNNKG